MCMYMCMPPLGDETVEGVGVDLLAGGNGLLLTSSFMRAWLAKHAMRPPTTWHVHTSGSDGRPWHEVDSPASSVAELRDYLSAVLPALMYCSHFDERTARGAAADVMPIVRVEELMPLWPLLQTAMTQRYMCICICRGGLYPRVCHPTLSPHPSPHPSPSRLPSNPEPASEPVPRFVSTALTFAIHALMLSMLRVNGDRRCARISVTSRASLYRLLQQLDRDASAYTDPVCHLRVDLMQWWLSNVISCADHQWLPDGLKGAELQLAKAQLDQAMFLNPYVAGQQVSQSVGQSVGE